MFSLTQNSNNIIPVMFVKPFKRIPRFAVGFTSISGQGEIISYRKTFAADIVKEISVPFMNTTALVSGDHIKPIKHSNLMNFKKVKVKELTVDHMQLLDKDAIMLTMCADGLKRTLSKRDIITTLSNIREAYPNMKIQDRNGFNSNSFVHSVFMKLELMGLRHIAPVVMSNLGGIMINIYVMEIDKNAKGLISPLNGISGFTTATASIDSLGEIVEEQQPSAQLSRKKGQISKNTVRDSCFPISTITCFATPKDQKDTFDGGPLNIRLTGNNSRHDLGGALDLTAFLSSLISYRLDGDLICVE